MNNNELYNKDNKTESNDSNLSYVNEEIPKVLQNNLKTQSESLFNCKIILQNLVEGAASLLR